MCPQAGRVIDTRVVLPDLVFDTGGGGFPEKGPTKIDEEAQGGEVELLEPGLQPEDLAWRSMGPHWTTSLFSGGNVWLVNTAGMGPRQRLSLGLGPAPAQGSAVPGRRQQERQLQAAGDEDSSDEEDSAAEVEGRWGPVQLSDLRWSLDCGMSN